MKLSALILISVVSLISMVACNVKQDNEDAGKNGTLEVSVSNSDIAGDWIGAIDGAKLIVQDNSIFIDKACQDRQGMVLSILENKNCADGFKCGSFNFSVSPYSSVNQCNSLGQTACTYLIDKTVTPNTMKLTCRDRVNVIKYSYTRM